MLYFETKRLHMIKDQVIERGVKSSLIIDSMKRISREDFVLPRYLYDAYADRPLSIGCSQTISQPYMIAYMLELLELTGREKVLEIGTGSGYQTALLSHCAKNVFSMEIIPEICEFAKKNLRKLHRLNITLINGDGKEGFEPAAPYDRIIVGAYRETVPTKLLEQLKEGGIMVMPIGHIGFQHVVTIKKVNGEFIHQKHDACVFVPLV